MRRAGIAAAVLAAASVTLAADAVWQPIGPEGGPIVSIVRDPADALRLWVSTGRIGVLRSENGGRSWTPANQGLPTGSTNVIVLSSAGLLVGAGGYGLFRSADAGDSWTPVDGIPASVTALAVDPRFPSIVYAGAFPGFFRSRDGGLNWSVLPYPGNSSTTIVVDPTNSRVYSGEGACSFSSPDLGATWKSMACVFYGGPVRDFLPDPASPDAFFVALEAISPRHFRFIGGLYRSVDAGATLENVTGTMPASVQSVRFAPDGSILAGTSGGLFSSRDNAASWQPVGSFPPVSVDEILAEPGAEIFVGTRLRGLFGSSDGGASWIPRSRGIRGTRIGAVSLDPRMSTTIWAGSADPDGRMAVSRDGGASWDWRDGFPSGVFVKAIAADPSSSAHVLAAAMTPYDNGAPSFGSLWTSTDAGMHWSAAPFDTPPTIFPLFTGFAFDLGDPRRVFAGQGSPGFGALYSSVDGGDSWSIAVPGSGGGVALDPTDARRMYTLNFRSGDFGATWREMEPGQASSVTVGAAGVLYVGTSAGVVRSDDFGVSFRDTSAAIATLDIAPLAADPALPKVFAVGRPTSGRSPPHLIETRDGGASWSLADAGLPSADVLALAVDPTSGFGYAAGDGGLYRRIETDAACRPASHSLCLGGGRFRVQVVWTTSSGKGSGQTFPLTSDTGAFWFFSANNIELAVKVVDGRAVDGHFWVFGAGLTDVEYDLAVTDTETGKVWTHHNDAGTLASFADTSAF